MKSLQLRNMTRGWFVGAFSPTALHTELCEAAVNYFNAGESEEAHYHKLATEVTVIISGQVRMFEKDWKAGDIVVAEPGDVTAFEALSDSVIAVIKTPCCRNDKYPLKDL